MSARLFYSIDELLSALKSGADMHEYLASEYLRYDKILDAANKQSKQWKKEFDELYAKEEHTKTEHKDVPKPKTKEEILPYIITYMSILEEENKKLEKQLDYYNKKYKKLDKYFKLPDVYIIDSAILYKHKIIDFMKSMKLDYKYVETQLDIEILRRYRLLVDASVSDEESINSLASKYYDHYVNSILGNDYENGIYAIQMELEYYKVALVHYWYVIDHNLSFKMSDNIFEDLFDTCNNYIINKIKSIKPDANLYKSYQLISSRFEINDSLKIIQNYFTRYVSTHINSKSVPEGPIPSEVDQFVKI